MSIVFLPGERFIPGYCEGEYNTPDPVEGDPPSEEDPESAYPAIAIIKMIDDNMIL